MQNQQIDLSTITDVNELKAMAYDRIGAVEQHQAAIEGLRAELGNINTRIGQIMAQPPEDPMKPLPKKAPK